MEKVQYMPGDPRLVDQLVYELKSKGIFDQFRKECIADVDTRPAYQNLRQRVETSVSNFLSRQIWNQNLNKNQLREKLRKHILEGNYLEQGLERIVDQVVNPKVASVFIPQVEDVVYNYLGIPRKKPVEAETSEKTEPNDLLPTDLEAVSPGSVNNDDKPDVIDVEGDKDLKMEVDTQSNDVIIIDDDKKADEAIITISEHSHDSNMTVDQNTTSIPLPAEDIKLESIPAPENSPPNSKDKKIDLDKINLPQEQNPSTDIPLPDEIPKLEKDYFKSNNSDDDESSSDLSLRRNMSPLTPIRNFNNENSCDAQQGYENESDNKCADKEPSSFRFAIEKSNSSDKIEKKDDLSYQFDSKVNINTFNTPAYDDSSNSNNLQIDYESDANSKAFVDIKIPEPDQTSTDKKEKRDDRKSSSHKSSHQSRDSHRHSSSKDKKDSKHSSRDSSRHDRKSKDDHKSKSSSSKDKEKSEKKDSTSSRDSSKHRSSHKSSSKDKYRSSSKHSSSRDDKKSSKDKDKSSDKKDKPRESSKSHKSDSRKSSSSSKKDEKDKDKKDKKDTDDHYSVSGRGNHTRRSTDRDSNDGSTSSKGSHNQSGKTAEAKKDTKSTSKSGTSSSDSTSPSDKEIIVNEASKTPKPVRVENLEPPKSSPPRLPFVPDVTLKKPKFAANMEEAKRMIKMRKFLEDEQKRMNQEAALLLEFQANVRPSLSQVYSSIPGPELEFACMNDRVETVKENKVEITEKPTETQELKTEIAIEVNEITETVNEPVENTEDNSVIDEIKDNDETIVVEEIKNNNNNIDTTSDDVKEVLSDPITDYFKEIHGEECIEIEKDSIAATLTAMHMGNSNVTSPKIAELSQSRDDIIQTLTNNGEVIVNSDNEINIEVELICHNENQNDYSGEEPLLYFTDTETQYSKTEQENFETFLNDFEGKVKKQKIFLINCDPYEENLIKEACENLGVFEIVNYYKNGTLKLQSNKIVKDVNLNSEISLPIYEETKFNSPITSECSFELTSGYDEKLENMVNKTSRQEIMEIILGSGVGESPSKMPLIDYCMDSKFDDYNGLKRKYSDMETSVNNNRHVLTPKKMRTLSDAAEISSTTEEPEVTPNNNKTQPFRSKYLGKARRVGLPKPKKTNLPNSPSSDKSVENYSQNCTTPTKPKTPRNKVQRYATSDLYKPKLHYLSRRNLHNISTE